MDEILHISSEYIPANNTKAFALLMALVGKSPLSTLELTIAIGANPRSALQALGNETYGYWMIHNIGGQAGLYQLDFRHLTGCIDDDCDARVERRKLLADASKNQSEREAIRYSLALLKQIEATREYQERFNFDQLEEVPAKD